MDLWERAQQQSWYHCLELAPGKVTDGWFDMRPYADEFGLPERMDGMRALDVGTFDGFWAFEMEKRGATVVALDIDDQEQLDRPPRRRASTFDGFSRKANFELAREMLGLSVERVSCSIYDARPEVLGTFDFVTCNVMLLHLRDQLRALERIAALCRGTLITGEEHDRATGLLPFAASRYFADRDKDIVFWLPSAKAWGRMLWTAGFDDVRRHKTLKVRSQRGFSLPIVVHHASGSVLAECPAA